jgi:hypothetical protein
MPSLVHQRVLSLTGADEVLIAECTARFGYDRETAIDRLRAFGDI